MFTEAKPNTLKLQDPGQVAKSSRQLLDQYLADYIGAYENSGQMANNSFVSGISSACNHVIRFFSTPNDRISNQLTPGYFGYKRACDLRDSLTNDSDKQSILTKLQNFIKAETGTRKKHELKLLACEINQEGSKAKIENEIKDAFDTSKASYIKNSKPFTTTHLGNTEIEIQIKLVNKAYSKLLTPILSPTLTLAS